VELPAITAHKENHKVVDVHSAVSLVVLGGSAVLTLHMRLPQLLVVFMTVVITQVVAHTPQL
jgi:hypothetical protein